jgi:hypothetical protein
MSGKNHFRKLKDYAEKIVKFKQGVHINACYEQNLISEPVYRQVKQGVCAALVAEWLEGNLSPSGSSRSSFHRGEGVHSEDDADNLALAARFALEYKTMDDLFHGHVANSYDWLGKQHHLKIDGKNPVKDEEFVTAMTDGAETLWPGCGAFIVYKLGNTEKNHCVGLIKREDRDYLFFDCNIGAYQITEHNFKTFFEKYKEVYEATWEEWKIGETLCFDVSPVG